MVPRWETARVTGPGGEVAHARGGNAEGKGGRPLLTTIGDTNPIGICGSGLIDTLAVSDGYLPPRTYGLVIEWASIHENELRAAWNRISHHETPSKISPLA